MALKVDHVSYIYDPDAPLSHKALDDISLTIPEGQFIGVIGHTGSGKSTLMQHLNGLVKATSGHIYFNGRDIDVMAEMYNTAGTLTVAIPPIITSPTAMLSMRLVIQARTGHYAHRSLIPRALGCTV